MCDPSASYTDLLVKFSEAINTKLFLCLLFSSSMMSKSSGSVSCKCLLRPIAASLRVLMERVARMSAGRRRELSMLVGAQKRFFLFLLSCNFLRFYNWRTSLSRPGDTLVHINKLYIFLDKM
mmetsp:Transcript_10724/g.17561  ORF Transcript_10724/g.17561 Transcript_10724/m.17561 type:complete len:122 (+) Transcript_10724:2948-3313(+)